MASKKLQLVKNSPEMALALELATSPDTIEEAKRILNALEDMGALVAIPLGGRESLNVGRIEITREGATALKERLTNQVDSLTELGIRSMEADGLLRKIPDSPQEAAKVVITEMVRVGMGIGLRKAQDLLDKAINTNSQDGDVVMVRQIVSANMTIEFLDGSGEDPTLRLVDMGEGIHPTDFWDTILGLGKGRSFKYPDRIKMYLAYFGQGGTTACSHSRLGTLFVSSRHPKLRGKLPDEVGVAWIERRNLLGRYQYVALVPSDGTVLSLPRSKVMRKVPGSILGDRVNWHMEQFPEGCTIITHYNYDMGAGGRFRRASAVGHRVPKLFPTLIFNTPYMWSRFECRDLDYEDNNDRNSLTRLRRERAATHALNASSNLVYKQSMKALFHSNTTDAKEQLGVNVWVIKGNEEAFGGEPARPPYTKVKPGEKIPHGYSIDAGNYLLDRKGQKVPKKVNSGKRPSDSYVYAGKSVFYTMSGITQAMLGGATLLNDEGFCNLGALMGRIVVEVQLDQLSPEVSSKLFSAARDGLVQSDEQNPMTRAVQAVLSADTRLRELAQEALEVMVTQDEDWRDKDDKDYLEKRAQTTYGSWKVTNKDRGMKATPENQLWRETRAKTEPTQISLYDDRMAIHPDRQANLYIFGNAVDGYTPAIDDMTFFTIPGKTVEIVSASSFHQGVTTVVVKINGVKEDEIFQMALTLRTCKGQIQSPFQEFKGMVRGRTGGGKGSPTTPKIVPVPTRETNWPDHWDENTVGEYQYLGKTGGGRRQFRVLINTNNKTVQNVMEKYSRRETRRTKMMNYIADMAALIVYMEMGSNGMEGRNYEDDEGHPVAAVRTWEHRQQDYTRILHTWISWQTKN